MVAIAPSDKGAATSSKSRALHTFVQLLLVQVWTRFLSAPERCGTFRQLRCS